ncbi:MAG TPA: glycosyltransferase [Solirubrobacteraceae bacterium]|jgi:GT2 family glycosyltransferase
MSARPPHPPSPGGKLADYKRRFALTLRYHGPKEVAIRLLTYPLRPTPLGAKLGYGSRYGPVEAAARRWYRRRGRRVCVVIPTYGDPSLAAQAVASIRRTTRRAMVRVVVVDDASPSPEHARAVRAIEGAEVVVLGENRGFAGACNAGIARAAAGEDVIVVNSDVVARSAWLPRLQYAAYERDRIGIAGPKLLYPDERIQSAGSFRNLDATEWFDHRYRFRDGTDPQANIPVALLAATGACMYLRRDMLDEIGAFDEAYGMAYEDVDLCLRAWEAGWETTYAPRSTLLHLESQTRPVEPGERELASQRLFWRRWGAWFDERDVRTPDGGLRVIYVTQDTGVGGGHRDIFEHVNRLRARGHDAQLWSLAGQPEWFGLDVDVRRFADYDALERALAGEQAIKVATWWNTGRAVWRASVRRGIPVFFVQDVEVSYYPDDLNMQYQVLNSYRQEFRYLTISGWNAERLREMALHPAIVPPGIDLDTWRPLPGSARRDDMVLALGRANPLKNFPLTVDAWRALGPAGPELTLFGVEPEVRPEGRSRYLVRPSDAEVNALFNECTVFVQTSVHEGFCLPPLEAMAAGAAVVCTDAHGNRDFCVDGVNCLMPEPTVASVSGALERLLGDGELRARLGAAGQTTAADYAWEKRIDELEAYFEGVAAPRVHAG